MHMYNMVKGQVKEDASPISEKNPKIKINPTPLSRLSCSHPRSKFRGRWEAWFPSEGNYGKYLMLCRSTCILATTCVCILVPVPLLKVDSWSACIVQFSYSGQCCLQIDLHVFSCVEIFTIFAFLEFQWNFKFTVLVKIPVKSVLILIIMVLW